MYYNLFTHSIRMDIGAVSSFGRHRGYWHRCAHTRLLQTEMDTSVGRAPRTGVAGCGVDSFSTSVGVAAAFSKRLSTLEFPRAAQEHPAATPLPALSLFYSGLSSGLWF